MLQMNRPLTTWAALLLTVLLLLALVACAPSSDEASGEVDEPDATEEIVFIDDATCLSCHGGDYTALALSTSELGDWNPHDSIHGGYNSCVNCHGGVHTEVDNACEDCHVYAPASQ